MKEDDSALKHIIQCKIVIAVKKNLKEGPIKLLLINFIVPKISRKNLLIMETPACLSFYFIL